MALPLIEAETIYFQHFEEVSKLNIENVKEVAKAHALTDITNTIAALKKLSKTPGLSNKSLNIDDYRLIKEQLIKL